jgi:hypothetical protein
VAIYACELPPAQQKFVSRKSVVLWGHENLLGYSVEFLLNTRNCLDLVRISKDLGVDVLIEQVEKIHPDVVVIYEMNSSDNASLPMRLMKNQVWLKVILVNLENNTVEVFNKQMVQINEGSDLLSIVEGCPRLPCTIE